MRRSNTFIIVAISLLLAFGVMACSDGGGGGGGGAEVAGTGLISITSFHHNEADTDGDWAVWVGRDRDRIMVNDGTGTVNYANGLDELVVTDVEYDGRYILMRAHDSQQPCVDSDAALASSDTIDSWDRAALYMYDTEASPVALVQLSHTASSGDRMNDPYAIEMKDGMAAVMFYDQVNNRYGSIWMYDLSGENEPAMVSTQIGTNSPISFDGDWVVWEQSSDSEIYAVDVSDLSGTLEEPFALTSLTSSDWPVVNNGIVAWRQTNITPYNIYANDLNDSYSTNVDLTASIGSYCYAPAVAGSYVGFECGDEIYVAYVGDLANFDPAVGTGDVQRLTDDGVQDGDVRMAGDYLVWVSNGNELYGAILDEGVYGDITLISENLDFYYDQNPRYDHEQWSNDNVMVDEAGNVAWTVDLEDVIEPDAHIEYVFTANINDPDPVYLESYNAFQKVKAVSIVDGKVNWLTSGTFPRVFAKKIGSTSAPVAISQSWYKVRSQLGSVAVDGDIVAWSAKDGLVCEYDAGEDAPYDIWYAKLNTDAKTPVMLASSNSYNLARPVVDGANGIIAWHEAYSSNYESDYGGIGYGFVADNSVHSIPGTYESCSWLAIEDGWLAYTDYNDVVYAYNMLDDILPIPVSGVYGADHAPKMKDGVIVWRDNSDYNLWYFDLNDDKLFSSRVTKDHPVGSTSYENMAVGGGYVIFTANQDGGVGTETIYAYAIGDPADSVEAIFEEDPDDYTGDIASPTVDNISIDKFDFDGQYVVFKYAICDPEIFYMALGDDEATQLSENYVPDTDAVLANGAVIWLSGGGEGHMANYWVEVLP